MESLRKITIIVFLLAAFNPVNGQPRMQPKKINAKENYTHSSTHFNFPKSLLGDFQRESVYSFDKKNQNVGVSYGKKQNGERTLFSLYLYPAGDGSEGRLRKEYLNSMQSVVATRKKGLHATQNAVQHKGEKYICNGFEAIFTTEKNELSQLTIFESGTWFYKIRITSSQNDTTLLANLKTQILQVFDPTVLADLTLLNEKVSVYYNKTAFRDSVLLGSAMGSAFGKIDWIMENVDERERATGFPDLYLNFHIAGLKAFMEFQYRFDYGKSDFTKNYLKELQLIADADFLNEFVMEQYGMILIIPENTTAKYDEYLKWKSQNNITINLNELFYVLSFEAKKRE